MIVKTQEDVIRAFDVSRETEEKLEIYVGLLIRWQKILNLIAPNTIPHIWGRHIADSLQIHSLAPDIIHWVDLGSGGGFPGLVTAIRLFAKPMAHVTLIESDKRKCSFLREVIRATGCTAEVISDRIENVLPVYKAPIEAFSARALAPLTKLLPFVDDHLGQGAKAYFLKGKDAQRELTEVVDLPRYKYKSWPSLEEGGGCILEFQLKCLNKQ
jgi:16S rRNA (guanine527-N7)-methyltransferase